MQKIIIVLPYFGKFPNYFNLFLNSCKKNYTIDWLIISDQSPSEWKIPTNVIWETTDFQKVCKEIRRIYNVIPTSPYDLCKYRVAYHRIFSKFIVGYDFWGYCDCDVIFGDIRHFLTEEILNAYPKISWRGHLTLFRNIEPYNSAFLTKIQGFKSFEGCIGNTDGINLFDEVGINKIYDYLGYPIYTKLPLCDLRIRDYNFICNHDVFPPETNINQIFRWKDGKLFRLYSLNGEVNQEEVIYVHFLKRPMDIATTSISESSSYLIVPNEFISDRNIDYITLLVLSQPHTYWSYWLKRLTPRRLFKKIKEKIIKRNNEVDEYIPR